MESDEDAPVPPAKGYNLDFLDQLDDPNFNPFETKTAVKNQFEASEIVQESTESIVKNSVPETDLVVSNISEENTPKEPASTEPEANATTKSDQAKTAVNPKKPLIRRNVKPKKAVSPKKQEDVEPVEGDEENSPLPPPKSYNMDFLDNLDDPNFNPFETKTAVKDNFDATEPTSSPASDDKET
eukprot:TRINITY_DN5693_c0_g1_i2.p1 TRINITY_DN5693_c0_g1~~TRINITY_DN5693_c0_g1_i2.p1  ORF type:complete len:184 (-),score=61.99 TRINITY_DN5693_c0_g1_i2:131-682(-)